MKGSRKQQPPEEFAAWLALENEDWKPAYPIDSPTARQALIAHLRREQRGLCVYCGRALDISKPGKSFHVEHFRPRNGPNASPHLSVDHENLFLSCGQEDDTGNPAQTCATHKADWFEENAHVPPAYPACTRRFRFLLTGGIRPADPTDQAAEKMIQRLKLDHPELVKDRETALILLDDEQLDLSDFWDTDIGMAESLAHIAYQHQGATLP